MNKYFYPIFKLPTFYERDYVNEELPLWVKWWLLGKAGRELSEILTGSEFTLLHTLNRKFKILQIKGNTEQEQLTGKNKFNFSNAIKTAGNIDLSNYGVNYSIENQILSLNGTMNATNTFILGNLNEDAGSYTLSIDVLSGTISGEVYVNVVTASESKQLTLSNTNARLSFSVTEPIEKITVYIGNGRVFTNYKIRIQLEQGSTATSYEPYCGGIPSPNPEFPQPIKNVTGSANVKIQNKNLLNETTFITGKALNIVDGSLQDASDRMTSDFIEVKPNINYICNKLIIRFVEYDENKQLVHSGTSVDGTPITMKPNAKYFRTTFAMDLTDIQIEQGSTATSYVAHQEQNLPFTLGDIELCKINTAQDYFYKENGKWYLHKEIRKRTISSVSGIGTASSGIKYASIGAVPNVLNNSYIYCENYINSSDASKNNSIRFAGVNLFVYDNRFTDVETAQSLLNGLEYYHIMATPTETEITDTTLLEQLEATLQARTYDDITYIASTSDELPPELDIQYWKERGAEE